MTSTSECPILTGPENYSIWRIRIQAKLAREKVWTLVSGAETNPSVPILPTPAASSTAPSHLSTTSSSTSTPSSGDSWAVRDNKASGIILGYLSDSTLLQLNEKDFISKPSKELFDEVVRIHTKLNVGSSIFYTFISLLESHWDGSSPVEDHIAKIRGANQKLISFGKPMGDEFMAYFLLHSLPQSSDTWKNFTPSVVNSVAVDKALDLSSVESRILAEATRLKGSHQSNAPAEAALKISKPKTSPPKCCDIHGQCHHDNSECRDQKQKKQGNFKKRKEKAHQAKESDPESTSDSDGEVQAHGASTSTSTRAVHVSEELMKRVQLYLASNPTTGDAIIADTGASAHMFASKASFIPGSYQLLPKPRKVAFGDESHCEAVGVGSVIMISHVGNVDTELEFTNVLHVPSFKINLISVSKLCKKGLKASFTEDLCRFRRHHKSNRKTLLCGRLFKGLYHLNLMHPSYPEKANASIDINLLHQRTGHAGVGRLKHMVRNSQLQDIEKSHWRLQILRTLCPWQGQETPI